MDELLDSLAKSSDSAVGPDDIHYQMLKRLPSDALQSLLNTLNDIWLSLLVTFLLHGVNNI